jgi:hypothetical protein
VGELPIDLEHALSLLEILLDMEVVVVVDE